MECPESPTSIFKRGRDGLMYHRLKNIQIYVANCLNKICSIYSLVSKVIKNYSKIFKYYDNIITGNCKHLLRTTVLSK